MHCCCRHMTLSGSCHGSSNKCTEPAILMPCLVGYLETPKQQPQQQRRQQVGAQQVEAGAAQLPRWRPGWLRR